jgi:hypothetical protein
MDYVYLNYLPACLLSMELYKNNLCPDYGTLVKLCAQMIDEIEGTLLVHDCYIIERVHD